MLDSLEIMTLTPDEQSVDVYKNTMQNNKSSMKRYIGRNAFQKLISKYKLSVKETLYADVIVVDGVVYKDRYNTYQGEQNTSIVPKILTCGTTEYGEQRVYRNYEIEKGGIE